MRMIIGQAQLLKGLQLVERAVNDRSALPILANVLLETKGHELVLTATDLDVGVRYQLPLTEQPEPGAATLPARRFTTIVRELPDGLITIEAKNNHTILLDCETSHFRIPGLPPEDFPILPPPTQEQPISIPQPHLKTLITHTAFAMSMEETRFILNGALLKTHEGTLALVATDGRRLAFATAPHSKHTHELAVVIPAKTIRELGRLLQEDGDEPVTIAAIKDNQLLFQFGAVTIITRLIEGQFPDYERVIASPSNTTLTCARQLLVNAVRRASLMTTAASQAVVFELAKGRLVVSKESAELGSAREELPATYRGEPMTIAFNPEFWLDALKVLEVEDVTIELVSPEKPAVIRLPQLLYVVLPMKLA